MALSCFCSTLGVWLSQTHESASSLCIYILGLKILSNGVITVKFMKEAMYEGLIEDFCFKQFTDN